jgi:hypothetical protein
MASGQGDRALNKAINVANLKKINLRGNPGFSTGWSYSFTVLYQTSLARRVNLTYNQGIFISKDKP